ncbi:MAG: gliding motility-associated C-terminal domain-containing protein [Bacteroidota bacterium]|nr:gliding motility-associated C-terminal domain-containing protein [Bacteroidota bacterium]
MKLKKNTIVALSLILLISVTAKSQIDTIARQVLGTTGGSAVVALSSGMVTIDFTVGECMVTTIGPPSPFTVKNLTQGFQQPETTNNALNISVSSVNSTCTGASNGAISIAPLTFTGPLTYSWTGPVTSTSNFVANLSPGTYVYLVSDGNFSITDSVVITEDSVDCGEQLIIYSGVTPNGDGNNDTWQIDGITNFESNSVWIYNRWGDISWQAKDYDNVTVVWDGKNSAGTPMLDATYFYLIEVGGKTYKGWVELTH